MDPKWFIPDPDPALNFPSSGSRQKFRIHADPDPTHVRYLSIFGKCQQNNLKFNHKEESINIQREITFLFICSFMFCWIRIRNNNSRSVSRQKFRIHADPDLQHFFAFFLVLFFKFCLLDLDPYLGGKMNADPHSEACFFKQHQIHVNRILVAMEPSNVEQF